MPVNDRPKRAPFAARAARDPITPELLAVSTLGSDCQEAAGRRENGRRSAVIQGGEVYDSIKLRLCENSVFARPRAKSTFQIGPESMIGIMGGVR